jgi:DNA-directed RNA polymerase subunit RPC12/RpoP
MAKKELQWLLTEHACRHCGGRVLVSAPGQSLVTCGGNPIYRCADCGKSSMSMGPSDICWCGFSHRGQSPSNAYMCLPLTAVVDNPFLRQAFTECGCDPNSGRGEIGIVTMAAYERAMKQAQESEK